MRDPTSSDKQSFTALVRPHLDAMYRFAYRLTGRPADAQDLVQDVLLRLYPDNGSLAKVERLGPWLRRVLYRQFVDNHRRYAKARLSIVDHETYSANPDLAAATQTTTEDQVDQAFDIKRLQLALAGLSDDHRLIITLHDVEGYTLTEIVEITGISLGTIKSRRYRARLRLQEILEEGPG